MEIITQHGFRAKFKGEVITVYENKTERLVLFKSGRFMYGPKPTKYFEPTIKGDVKDIKDIWTKK